MAEATRSAATVGCRQAAAMGTEGIAVKRKHARAPSSAAVPTCIWMSFAASHRISSAVHDIGIALDVL